MSQGTDQSLDEAQRLVEKFIFNHCFAVEAEIAGNIRRQKPLVRDIDLVFYQPRPESVEEFRRSCAASPNIEIPKWGAKLATITYCGAPFDLYFSFPRPRPSIPCF